jgi:hypothetical protein
MLPTRICAECERLLYDVTVAMRRHEQGMYEAIELNKMGHLTEEHRQDLAPGLVASFLDTQAKWDTYRQHLDGHGLLKPALEGRIPA